MAIVDNIIALTKQLYPTGRAFRYKAGGFFDKLHVGLAQSEARAWADAVSILDSILPDNNNFSVDDASDWERRLGLITNNAVPLAIRKLLIKQKMNFPGTIPARQNYLYLEGQLQAAGFNVYVYENKFSDGGGGYVTKSVGSFSGITTQSRQHGDFQHGQAQHGGGFTNICANFIEENIDKNFNVGTNLRSTFFIGGVYAGAFATVPLIQKQQFRQMILKIKPVQSIAYLLINYV